ncbi:MAG: hypothetical protein ACE15C_14885 [Phycisphaerae bacterium]
MTLSFTKAEIAKTDRKPLDSSFFESKMNPPPKKLDTRFPSGTELYLEVPAVGRIGEQVVPVGITRSLSYAYGNGIKHVVFDVDSQGGDVDATARISRMLQQYDNRLTYHSIVRDAVGMAMVFPLYSKTIHLRAGATLGGAAIIFDPKKIPEGKTEAILKSQIATRAAAIAKQHGLPYQLVPAMVDPMAGLTVWRDSSGAVRDTCPRGPANKIILAALSRPAPYLAAGLVEGQGRALLRSAVNSASSCP